MGCGRTTEDVAGGPCKACWGLGLRGEYRVTDMSQPDTMTPEMRARFEREVYMREPNDDPPKWVQQSKEALLQERVDALERSLARVADDARAALSQTTHATLEQEHTVMQNALYAVMQATAAKPSLAHLYDLADNMLPPEAPRPVISHPEGQDR
jgi:hypothetical protein